VRRGTECRCAGTDSGDRGGSGRGGYEVCSDEQIDDLVQATASTALATIAQTERQGDLLGALDFVKAGIDAMQNKYGCYTERYPSDWLW
jgi:hypothetical protein